MVLPGLEHRILGHVRTRARPKTASFSAPALGARVRRPQRTALAATGIATVVAAAPMWSYMSLAGYHRGGCDAGRLLPPPPLLALVLIRGLTGMKRSKHEGGFCEATPGTEWGQG